MDRDCRLEPGVEGATILAIDGVVLVTGRVTFGLKSLRDLEGERADNRDDNDCVSLGGGIDEVEAMDGAEDLRIFEIDESLVPILFTEPDGS